MLKSLPDSLANSSMKYCGVATPFKASMFTLVLLWECLGPNLPRITDVSSFDRPHSRRLLPKSPTTCMLGKQPHLGLQNLSPIIGERFLPYSKKTIFAYLQPKLSSVQERPLYWAGCDLMAPCKLALTNWQHHPWLSIPQQYKASAPLSELTKF